MEVERWREIFRGEREGRAKPQDTRTEGKRQRGTSTSTCICA
jgi:hypothetical protein